MQIAYLSFINEIKYHICRIWKTGQGPNICLSRWNAFSEILSWVMCRGIPDCSAITIRSSDRLSSMQSLKILVRKYIFNNFISQVHEILMGWVGWHKRGITSFISLNSTSHFSKTSGRAFSLVFSDRSRQRIDHHHPIPAWEKTRSGEINFEKCPPPSASTCYWQVCCSFDWK